MPTMIRHDTDALPRRRLSSAQTWLMKFAFPIAMNVSLVFSALVCLGVIRIDWFKNQWQRMPPQAIWFLGAFGVYLNVMCALINWRLKRVEMDGENLYISNYMDEIVVPLTNVASVSESRMMNPRPITIKFHEPTEFGNRV